MIDLVLERALLGGEAVAERLELVFVGGGGQLGLDTRLEAGLGLGHELGARVVPRAKVGGGDRHGQIREVAHLCGRDRGCVRGKQLPSIDRSLRAVT